MNIIMKQETSNEVSGTETVIRYMDYRSQAEERRKELVSLRRKCLANTQASRLSGAEAPKEMAVFLQRQRSLFEQERQRRKEAADLIHGFSEENGIPPSMSREEENELEKSRKDDAFAFMSRYRAAKEAILRSTEAFWQDAKKEEDSSEDSPSPLECAKRWDSSNRELDDMITEMEVSLSLSFSSDDGDEIQAPSLKGGKGTWTVIWLSLMTMCSTNVVGLVLSLALLNFNIPPGTAGYEDLINMLGDGNFFSMCRELLEAVQESSDDDIPHLLSYDEQENAGALVSSSKPRGKGVQEEIYERLRDNLDQWMFDSATTFRQALTSIRNGGSNSDSRVPLSALSSPMEQLRGIVGNIEADEETETVVGEDGDDDTVSDTSSTSTWSPDFDSADIVDVPALLLKAQNSIHQLLLDTRTYDEDEEMIDLDLEVPDEEEYDRYTPSPIEFTRDETFDIAKLLTKAKEIPLSSEGLGKPQRPKDPNEHSEDREEKENYTDLPIEIDDQIIQTTSSEASSTIHASDSSEEKIEYVGDVYAVPSDESGPPNNSVSLKSDEAPSEPKDHRVELDTSSQPTLMETLIVAQLTTETEDDQASVPAEIEHEQSDIIIVTLPEETEEATSESTEVGVVDSHKSATTATENDQPAIIIDTLSEETEDVAPKSMEPVAIDLPESATTQTEDDQSDVTDVLVVIDFPEPETTETEDDRSNIVTDALPEETEDAASGSEDMVVKTPEMEGKYYDTIASTVPEESEREDQNLESDVSPKTMELPAENSRRWETFLALGAMTVIGFGASIALGANRKR